MALKTPASRVIIAWHNPEVIILFGNAAGSKVKREQGSNPALVNIFKIQAVLKITVHICGGSSVLAWVSSRPETLF